MATKYVRKLGSDSGNTGPFKTIQYGINQLESGDTLVVGDGVYTFNVVNNNNIKINTPNITLRSENKRGAVLTGTWSDVDAFPHSTNTWSKRYSSAIVVSASGVIVDGFVIRNSKGRGITCSGNNSIIQNCFVYDIFNSGIQSFQANNVTIQYNEIDNASRQRIWRGKTINGVYVNNHPNVCALVEGSGGTLRGNIVHDSGGEGIDVFRNSGGALVENNISYNNSSVQLYINRVGSGLIMRNNIAFQTKPASELIGNNPNSQPGGIDLRDEYQSATYPPSTDLEIYNNLIINCNQCIWIGSQANIKNMLMANNTVIQGPYTTRGVLRVNNKQDGKDWSNAEIVNNIFYGSSYEISADASLINWNYNCFYPGNPPAIIKGAFDVYSNPQFVNLVTNPTAANLNPEHYKLLVSSLCIDKGKVP